MDYENSFSKTGMRILSNSFNNYWIYIVDNRPLLFTTAFDIDAMLEPSNEVTKIKNKTIITERKLKVFVGLTSVGWYLSRWAW